MRPLGEAVIPFAGYLVKCTVVALAKARAHTPQQML